MQVCHCSTDFVCMLLSMIDMQSYCILTISLYISIGWFFFVILWIICVNIYVVDKDVNFLNTYDHDRIFWKSWSFVYICSHVYFMSGDAWKEGGIDATGKHHLKLSIYLIFLLSRSGSLILCEILFRLTNFCFIVS